MPIYTGKTAVEFGNGDVHLAIGSSDNNTIDSLLLMPGRPKEIGSPAEYSEPEVVLTFRKVESLDAVIKVLQELRGKLIVTKALQQLTDGA
jgi:hypothetical protein